MRVPIVRIVIYWGPPVGFTVYGIRVWRLGSLGVSVSRRRVRLWIYAERVRLNSLRSRKGDVVSC